MRCVEVPDSLRDKHFVFLIKRLTRNMMLLNFILKELEGEIGVVRGKGGEQNEKEKNS